MGVQGYEIHHGQTAQHPAMAAARPVMPEGLAWQNTGATFWASTCMACLKTQGVLQALFGPLLAEKDARLSAKVPTLDAVFDGLADYIDAHFAPGVLQGLVR